MRTLQVFYNLAMLLYPALAYLEMKISTEAFVENWIFLGMSLPHFCVWLALLLVSFALMKESWRPGWLERIRKNFGIFLILSLTVLFSSWYVFEVVSTRQVIEEFISHARFEEEPWKSRLMSDLDENGGSSEEDHRVHPINGSVFSIVRATRATIHNGDSRKSIEDLLVGTRYYSVKVGFSEGKRDCILYALPLGYFRYTELITVYYEDDDARAIIYPQWLLDSLT